MRPPFALVATACAIACTPAVAQVAGERLYSDSFDEVYFAGVRRDPASADRLVLSLDLLTHRTPDANRMAVSLQSDRSGTEIPPVQGDARLGRSVRTRRDYIIPRTSYPYVRIRNHDAGSLIVKSWTFEELAALVPPPPPLQAGMNGVERESRPDGVRYRLKLRLYNTRDEPGVPFAILRKGHDGSAYAMTQLSGPGTIEPGRYAEFTYDLRIDDAFPKVVVQAATRETVVEFDVAELMSMARDPYTPGDMAGLAGRYRMNNGTLMTFDLIDGVLHGNGQTVGPKPELSGTIQLRPSTGTDLTGDMYGYVGGRKTLNGAMTFYTHGRYPIHGRFADNRERADLAGCPVADDDPGNWTDSALRIGFGLWAKLEEVRTSLDANGRDKVLEVRLSVWSTAFGNAVLVRAGTGTQGKEIMRATEGFGGAYTESSSISRCQNKVMTFRTTGALEGIDTIMLEGTATGVQFTPPWPIGDALAKVGPAPPPPPATSPPPPPPTSSEPATRPGHPPKDPLANTGPSRPTTGGTAAAGTVPRGTETYSNYGIWDFRIEELKRGPDNHWQAVLWVRDAASYPVGMAPGQVTLVLIDEDGRMLRSDPLLYRASVTGPSQGLEVIPQTLWMEKGDEIRVRMVFDNSAGFEPMRFRIAGGGHDPLSRTWDMH